MVDNACFDFLHVYLYGFQMKKWTLVYLFLLLKILNIANTVHYHEIFGTYILL